MGEVYYTADLHIGHRLVSGLRGFWDEDNVIDVPSTVENPSGAECLPDTEAHDQAIAESWDDVVGPKDSVFVLGDLCISQPQYALDWIAARHGTKHLITGNHDHVHPMRTDAIKLLPHWHKYFETIQPFGRRKLLKTTVLMSHFPYDGDHTEVDRLPQYRLPNLGELLLHGHTHGTEVAHDNMFHVGLDAHDLRLVPQDEIINWVATRKEATA